MREYQKILGKNNPLQNQLALTLLFEKGRENILNDKFYNSMLKSVDEKPNPFMTADFQKEYIKISKDMASMKSNDLYDFIKNEVNITKNRNKER